MRLKMLRFWTYKYPLPIPINPPHAPPIGYAITKSYEYTIAGIFREKPPRCAAGR